MLNMLFSKMQIQKQGKFYNTKLIFDIVFKKLRKRKFNLKIFQIKIITKVSQNLPKYKNPSLFLSFPKLLQNVITLFLKILNQTSFLVFCLETIF